MTKRNLNFLFAPRSVAVIGASSRPHSIGAIVLKNLTSGGFQGKVWAVNPKQTSIDGRRPYSKIADLPEAPELAVVCTPAATVPAVIAQLAAHGTRAAVVISAGLEAVGADGSSYQSAMLEAAKPQLLRILGPNCIGLLSPRIGLNASFARVDALPGTLAFVSQSGALTTAMLDWARSQSIGFSHFISLGNSADVDFGDVLDYLCDDPRTRAILLYVESITSARKFMSAARAAARNKPVIVVKAGRAPEGARAAMSHTGALAGSDAVYEAAFRRAGIVRVKTTRELFDAAETLARMKSFSAERLIIVSNGGGPAVLATDALIEGKGVLAPLSPSMMTQLDAVLPKNWSHNNPVDIIGDAPDKRYAAALEALVSNGAADVSDAVLLIHAPTAVASSTDIANTCAPILKNCSRAVLTCWMGGDTIKEAEKICADAGIATYSTPEEGVGAFLQVVHYRQAQRLLLEVPSSLPDHFKPQREAVRAILDTVFAADRKLLMEPEAKAVLAAYGIPVVDTRIAPDVEAVHKIALEIGFPLALKILSPDISHKSDIGGVTLNISNAEQLMSAASAMWTRCRERLPTAHLLGFSVQPMVKLEAAIELIAGIADDATFGPVMLFGHGGTAVEVLADTAMALPPLNMALAHDLVSRTRVHKLLAGYRGRPAVDERAIQLTLVQLSQLVVDFPEIVELDINPLLAGPNGIIALDARIGVERPRIPGSQRLAIRPYPQELEEWQKLDGRELLIRPIRPEDSAQHRAFLDKVSIEDMHTRFFRYVRELSTQDLASLTQIDYERAMAFIAIGTDAEGRPETLGVVRAHADPDNTEAEFAILIRSDWGGRGLGTALLSKIVAYCRSRGLRRIWGEVLTENSRMLRLAKDLGFRHEFLGDGAVRVSLELCA